jgi:hypothetical protein
MQLRHIVIQCLRQIRIIVCSLPLHNLYSPLLIDLFEDIAHSATLVRIGELFEAVGEVDEILQLLLSLFLLFLELFQLGEGFGDVLLDLVL